MDISLDRDLFKVDPDGTRADEVINNHNGSVAAWAKHFETPKGT